MKRTKEAVSLAKIDYLPLSQSCVIVDVSSYLLVLFGLTKPFFLLQIEKYKVMAVKIVLGSKGMMSERDE